MNPKKPMLFKLEVTVLEDLHAGTGTGAGDVDALVERDRRGRPVIRASHLKGLLREAGEELTLHEPTLAANLNRLLGTSGSTRGALELTSLRTTDEGRTLVWGSTARQVDQRAPQDDTLRFVEHVAAGTVFHATLRLADPTLTPLLERLLRRVDRLGGHRNRGAGLVRVRPTPILSYQQQVIPAAAGPRLRLILRNLEPLCLPTTGHPGNLIRTHSFIRGQTLRGALMSWLIRSGCSRDDLKIFDQLSIGDALPFPESTGTNTPTEVLPIPLSILTDKPRAATPPLPWWADRGDTPVTIDSLYQKKDETKEKPKRPGEHEYVCRYGKDGDWLRYTPQLSVRLRNATPKRGSNADALLFSQEEVAEDTRLVSEVRCPSEHDAAWLLRALAPLLEGTDWITLGRGGAPTCIEAVLPVTPPETKPNATGTKTTPGVEFTDDWSLTLQSDLILRGPNLGFLDYLDMETLCTIAKVVKSDDQPWKIENAVTETTPIHGFNAVSGLRRAPALAIRRGSCWRVTGVGSAALAEALSRIEALGERTEEGFGRFVLNAQRMEKLEKPSRIEKTSPENRLEVLHALAKELAGQIESKGPSLSQLQWLRERALASRDNQELKKLLEDIQAAHKNKPQGGKAWEFFPHPELSKGLKECKTLDEQRQLISLLVQWRVPAAKEESRKERES